MLRDQRRIPISVRITVVTVLVVVDVVVETGSGGGGGGGGTIFPGMSPAMHTVERASARKVARKMFFIRTPLGLNS